MGNIFVFSDTDLVTIARVLLAFFLGGVVGIQREWARRPAGLRTHMLVCAGSACFTVASIYGFNIYGANVDPSRLAAQIITGVGFLGAGAIFRSGTAVRRPHNSVQYLDYRRYRHRDRTWYALARTLTTGLTC